jgi:hypothetical protein
MDEARTAIAGWLLNRPGTRSTHSWDEWFFAAISAVAALGIFEILLRKKWAGIIGSIAFGAGGLWAFVIGLAPESWRGVWFSTWVDRWAAVLMIALSIGGFWWFYTRQVRGEFETAKQSYDH